MICLVVRATVLEFCSVGAALIEDELSLFEQSES